jgi:hypothetical protein
MSGYYELVCDICDRSIDASWVCAWSEDGPKPYSFATLHWGGCLEFYKAMNESKEVRNRGMPHFKLKMECIFGEYADLVGDEDGAGVLRLRYSRPLLEHARA